MANVLVLGGPMVWPLGFFSLVTTALILERCWFWSQIGRTQKPVVEQVLAAYRENPQAVPTLLKSQLHLPMARILWSALSLPQASPEEFRLALETAAQAEILTLKRFQTFFETVIGVAPLLGLLGTILGLIQVLSTLEGSPGAAQPSLGLASGIGAALISTAAGLVVAIVTLLFANLFQSLYRRQRAFIEETGGKFELLHRRHWRQNGLGPSAPRRSPDR